VNENEFSTTEISEEDRTFAIEESEIIVDEYEQKKEQLERLLEESKREWESLILDYPTVLPKTWTPILERVSVSPSPYVVTDLPGAWIFRLAWDTEADLNHWLQVLPLEDIGGSKYIVIPSNGLVIPINSFEKDSSDFDNMINGREADINKPLETWALEYPWSSTKGYGEVWNKVIFWHSSYFGESLWRYKTHFQKIIELDAWEEIWVYEKQGDGQYKRHIYVTEQSYNTAANDTSVLDPGFGKNLTLFTCTPIGWIAGRWIIKAKYYDEVLPSLKREVYFEDVSWVYKSYIEQFFQKLGDKSADEKTQLFAWIFLRVQEMKSNLWLNRKVYRILEYIEFRVAQELVTLNN
jgi:hypothetical protein